MGSYGSGSRNRFASKTDEFHKLDLADFKRAWFERWRSGTVTWSRGGHKTGCVSACKFDPLGGVIGVQL